MNVKVCDVMCVEIDDVMCVMMWCDRFLCLLARRLTRRVKLRRVARRRWCASKVWIMVLVCSVC